MKILIIDNNIDLDSWGAEPIRRLARAVPGATVTARRAPQEDLPADPRAFDRVVVSGSRTSAIEPHPWVDKLDSFIRETVEAGVPYFGICYGHQSLVRALGGEQYLSNQTCPEYGWTRIQKLAESPLFKGLPDVFYSFSTHSDEVVKLPPSLKLLARSEKCGVQACQLTGKPVFGIQFHPEKDLDDAAKIFREELPKRGKDGLLHYGQDKKFYDPELGHTLFKNFIESA